MEKVSLCLILAACCCYFGGGVLCCNEAVCSSVVTKCILISECTCGPKNITCYKNCFDCLASYAIECCSCLEICPKAKETTLDKQFSACNLSDPNPDLFNVLTEFPDPQGRWTAETFPLHQELSNIHSELNQEIRLMMKDKSAQTDTKGSSFFDLNCTVTFLSKCLSLKKCENTCASMGASRYQWFHDGCCECMGNNCVYGIQESKCRRCSLKELEKNTIDENYDYGEDEEKWEDEWNE